jgi:hypothetical protein
MVHMYMVSTKVSIVIYLQTCYIREGGSYYFYAVSSSLFECGLNLRHPPLHMYSYMTCPFGLDDDHMFFFVHECIGSVYEYVYVLYRSRNITIRLNDPFVSNVDLDMLTI